jgi:hypothetical protein
MWERRKSEAGGRSSPFLERVLNALNEQFQYANAKRLKGFLPFVFILGVMFVSVLPGRAMQEADDGVLRVNTRLVLLDVIVRDDDGLVADLKDCLESIVYLGSEKDPGSQKNDA